MAITLVEVYQVITDIDRQAQEPEARPQDIPHKVQTLEAEVERLQALARTLEGEREKY